MIRMISNWVCIPFALYIVYTNTFLAYEDVAHITPLTKADIIAFYDRYISPLSPERAKLSVHLIAQSTPKLHSVEEQRAEALALATTLFAEHKIPLDLENLSSQLNALSLDSSSKNTDAILDTLVKHVTDLELPVETVKKVTEEASAALGLAVVGPAGEQPEVLTGEVAQTEKIGNGTMPVHIKDVHAWKAGLLLSKGVKPVKDLEEFVESEAKL